MNMTEPNSSDAFNDNLSFIKNLWGSMGVPGMQNMGMSMPTLSLEELDKRIQELKSVEAWLNVNLTMLNNANRALEIQRATIATLHSLSASMSQTMQTEPSAEKTNDANSPQFMSESMRQS